MELLNDFLRQVVVSRRDNGIRKWVTWLREDLSSRPRCRETVRVTKVKGNAEDVDYVQQGRVGLEDQVGKR